MQGYRLFRDIPDEVTSSNIFNSLHRDYIRFNYAYALSKVKQAKVLLIFPVFDSIQFCKFTFYSYKETKLEKKKKNLLNFENKEGN